MLFGSAFLNQLACIASHEGPWLILRALVKLVASPGLEGEARA